MTNSRKIALALLSTMALATACAELGSPDSESEEEVGTQESALSDGTSHALIIKGTYVPGADVFSPSVLVPGGQLLHARRGTNGVWTPFFDIATQVNNSPSVIAADTAAGSDNALHVFALGRVGNNSANLYRTIRDNASGAWTAYSQINAALPGTRGLKADVSAVDIQGQKHVVVTNEQGQIYHSILSNNATTVSFGDVEAQIGDFGTPRDVSVANVSNEMHLCITYEDGALYHSVRRANGTWTPAGDIFSQVGPRKAVFKARCAGVGGVLHVVFSDTAGGTLWHAVRETNGSWSGLGNVKNMLGYVGSAYGHALSSRPASGTLELTFVNQNGKVMFGRANATTRTWSGLQSATYPANDPGAVYELALE